MPELDATLHGCRGGPVIRNLREPVVYSPRVSSKDNSGTRQDDVPQVAEMPLGTESTAASSACVLWKCDEANEAPDHRAYAVNPSFDLRVHAVKTRSKRPGCSLLIDTGSPTNIMSDQFHKELSKSCSDGGVAEPQSRKRNQPLRIGGIGSGTQQADFDAKFNIGINQRFDEYRSQPKFAEFAAPVLPNSDIPGIVGQNSLKQNRVLLDCFNLRMYCIGPGEAIIELPPGSEMYDLEESRDGHLMLPCDVFPNSGTPPHGTQKIFHTSADTESFE